MAVHTRLEAAAPTGAAERWLAPALLGAGVLTALIAVGDRLLTDPDTQWHIAVGARIWRDGAVPWTDPFSHTFAGAPWLAKEWLAQLALFAAHAAGGWTAVVVLTAACLALTFALLFAWLERRLRASAAVAATLASIVFVAPHFLARPHVFGLFALLVWITGLSNAAEEGRAPSPWLLPVLVLWANLHGSFTIAYPLAGLVGLDALVAAGPGERATLLRRWAVFGVASILAGLVTPYGLGALLVTATLFGSGESLPFIKEWQPIGFDAVSVAALASAAGLLTALAFEPRRNALRLAGLAVLTLMFVRHARFLDIYALAAPVLAAAPLARRFAALRPEPSGSASAELGAVRAALPRLALAVLGAAALGLALAGRPVTDPAVTPDAALAAARRAGASGAVYNDYDFGGFLIARGVPTFIDGRTDQLFLGGFISGVLKAVRAEEDEGFLTLLDTRKVGWALVKPDGHESRHLDRASGWTRAYRDAFAAVYLRR